MVLATRMSWLNHLLGLSRDGRKAKQARITKSEKKTLPTVRSDLLNFWVRSWDSIPYMGNFSRRLNFR